MWGKPATGQRADAKILRQKLVETVQTPWRTWVTLRLKKEEGKKKNRNNLRMFLGVLSPENCRPWYFIFLRSTMEIDWHCFKVNSVKILLRLSGSQQTQHEENALQLTPDLENSVMKLEQAGPEFPPPKNEHRCKIQHTISRAYGIFQAYSNSSGMETIKTPHMI